MFKGGGNLGDKSKGRTRSGRVSPGRQPRDQVSIWPIMMHHEAIKGVGSGGRNSTKQGGVEGKIPSKKAPKVLVGSCDAERGPR